MKKITLIASIILALSSCGSPKYLPCPGLANNDTKEINENLTKKEYYEETNS